MLKHRIALRGPGTASASTSPNRSGYNRPEHDQVAGRYNVGRSAAKDQQLAVSAAEYRRVAKAVLAILRQHSFLVPGLAVFSGHHRQPGPLLVAQRHVHRLTPLGQCFGLLTDDWVPEQGDTPISASVQVRRSDQGSDGSRHEPSPGFAAILRDGAV